MEVFQWLFKLGKEIGKSDSSSFNSTAHEATTTLANHKTRKSSTRGSKDQKQRNCRRIWLWCQKDVADACFYSTLNLRRLGSLKREHLLRAMAKMKAQVGEEKEVTLTTFDTKKAIKVLDKEESNKEKVNNEQSKAKAKATLSRMKELIRWAASAKSDKAVKFFTPKIMELRKRKLKTNRETNEESKRMSSASISLRWESSESCTTFSSSDHISVVSAPAIFDSLGPKPPYRCRSRKGNWITTDSEFVVLEL